MKALLIAVPRCDPPSGGDDGHAFHAAEAPGYDDGKRSVVVGVMMCSRHAYNTTNVIMIADGDAVELAALPRIEADATYASPDDDTVLSDLRITSLTASIYAAGVQFDPSTNVLVSGHKLRGLGEASISTSWRLGRDGFVLETHDVDLTYNERQDPVRLVEKGRIIEPRPLGPRE